MQGIRKMNLTQNEVMKKLVNGTFTEEVLNNVLAVLEMRPVEDKAPAGFLTEKEACDFCGDISRSTLWHWKRNGLRSYKVGGRCLYSPDDLKRFIQATATVGAVEKEEA
jgi:hypothetical protein